MQTLVQGLGLPPTSHDKHFIKHITHMKSTSHNNRYDHRNNILISDSVEATP